jgi:hypothetical protein
MDMLLAAADKPVPFRGPDPSPEKAISIPNDPIQTRKKLKKIPHIFRLPGSDFEKGSS